MITMFLPNSCRRFAIDDGLTGDVLTIHSRRARNNSHNQLRTASDTSAMTIVTPLECLSEPLFPVRAWPRREPVMVGLSKIEYFMVNFANALPVR